VAAHQWVRVLDKYTVVVRLKYPCVTFPQALTRPIVRKEKKIKDPITYSNFEDPTGIRPFK